MDAFRVKDRVEKRARLQESVEEDEKKIARIEEPLIKNDHLADRLLDPLYGSA